MHVMAGWAGTGAVPPTLAFLPDLFEAYFGALFGADWTKLPPSYPLCTRMHTGRYSMSIGYKRSALDSHNPFCSPTDLTETL